MEQRKAAMDMSVITCKLCKSNLRETQVTLCCMSRFCKSCITNFLKVNSKQCPFCRKPINEDNIRTDASFDAMIALNLPNNFVKEEPGESANEIVTNESSIIKLALFSVGESITEPKLPTTSKFRYVHVPSETTVAHVAQFLLQRHLEETSNFVDDMKQYNPWTYPFSIFSMKKKSNKQIYYSLLPGDVMLHQVRDQYQPKMIYSGENSLELYFTFQMPPF